MSSSVKKPVALKERATRMAPEERREQLIRCAIDVFAEHGLAGAGHAQVARAANVSTPTVFLYLPNRQALLDAVLGEVSQYLIDMVERARMNGATASDKLMAITQAFADAIDSDPNEVRIFLNWSTVTDSESWPQYIEFQDAILNALADVINHGIERGEVDRAVNPMWGAHIVMGSAHMIAQMKFRGRDRQDIDAFLHTLVDGALSAGPTAQHT